MTSALEDSQLSESIKDLLLVWMFPKSSAYSLTNFSHYCNFREKFYSSIKLNEQEGSSKNQSTTGLVKLIRNSRNQNKIIKTT